MIFLFKKCILFFLISISFSLASPVHAVNDSKEQIAKKYIDSLPTSKQIYVETPHIDEKNPSIGKLDDSALQDGLKATNFARYLANLPDDIQIDEQLNVQAQYGALLLAISGEFSHHPNKPLWMSDEFYRAGYESTSSSNIGKGYASIYSSVVDGYMNDGDSVNIPELGHRRWILNPDLQKTGFGFADTMTAMQIFDTSRNESVRYDYIAFPSAGYMPLESFGKQFPWSVTVNPTLYTQPHAENISVTLTRPRDNKTWNFSKGQSDGIFYVNEEGFGIGNCIIFRPDDQLIQDGDTFNVTIEGLQKLDGSFATITYIVEFFKVFSSITVTPQKQAFTANETKNIQVNANMFDGQTKNITNLAKLDDLIYNYEDYHFKRNLTATSEFVDGSIPFTNNGKQIVTADGRISIGSYALPRFTFAVLPNGYNVQLTATSTEEKITGQATPNSKITATFADGHTLTTTTPKGSDLSTVPFSIPISAKIGSELKLVAEDNFGLKSDSIIVTVKAKSYPIYREDRLKVKKIWTQTENTTSMDISDNGKWMVTINKAIDPVTHETNSDVFLWDMTTGEKLPTTTYIEDTPKNVRISSDGTKVALLFDQQILIWDVNKHWTVTQIEGEFTDYLFTQDSATLITGNSQGSVVYFDMSDISETQKFNFPNWSIHQLAINETNQSLAIMLYSLQNDEQRNLHIQSLDTGAKLHDLHFSGYYDTSFAYTEDNKQLIVVGDGINGVYNVEQGYETTNQTIHTNLANVTSIDISKNNILLLGETNEQMSRANLIDLSTNSLLIDTTKKDQDMKLGPTTNTIFTNEGTVKEYDPLVVKEPPFLQVNPITDVSKTITGRGTSEAIITVKIGNVIFRTTKITDKETFSFSTSLLKAGTIVTISAETDGGTIEKTITVKDVTPPLQASINLFTTKSTLLSGKAEANSQVIIKLGSKTYTTKATSTQLFSFNIGKQRKGTFISVQVIDASQNKSKLVVYAVK